MVAHAISAWLASSLRLASVALRPLLVMVLRIAINDCVMSVAPASCSRHTRRMVSFNSLPLRFHFSGSEWRARKKYFETVTPWPMPVASMPI